MRGRSFSLLSEQQAVLVRVEEVEAQRARLYVEAADLRADVAELWADERSGFAEMELAGTGLVGQVRASRELSDGLRLRECLPQLRSLAAEGLVFVPTVEAVLVATRRCTAEVQLGVDARLAGVLVGRNVTDVRRAVAHAVLAVEAELDPELTLQREDAARQDARTWITPDQDGMTSIGAIIDAVAGRRWALDFDALVHAQRTLDKREGRDRTLQEISVEVFGNLPSLVLELVRAARDGRLTELAEAADVDLQAAADLGAQVQELAADLGGPTDDDAGSAAPGRGPAHSEPDDDPFDAEAAAALDPWADLPPTLEEPTGPEVPEGPPPSDLAAQDAARGDTTTASTAHSTGASVRMLLSRCLRMPLPTPTTVHLHLPMATALDLTDAPGVLEGHGPLGARRIRQLLPDARLRDVYVDRHTGVPLGTGPKPARRQPDQATAASLLARLVPVTLIDDVEPQHDPSTGLAAFVKLRDQRCPGPGCTKAATQCDLDHETEHPTGPTAEWNLSDKSRRCHGAKHHGWSCTRHPDGTTTWNSPTGRTYTSHPVWQPPPRATQPFDATFHLPPNDHVVEIELD